MSDRQQDCLFCRLVEGEIPAEVLAEGEDWLAFRDIAPQAPVHALLIPKRHIESVDHLRSADADLAGRLILAAAELARTLGVDEGGYRLVTNRGERAGQSVFHLHFHLLAGREMDWPPG